MTLLPQSRLAWFAVLYGTTAAVAFQFGGTSWGPWVFHALAFPLGYVFGVLAWLLALAAGPSALFFVAASIGVGVFLNGYLWGHVAQRLGRFAQRVAGGRVPESSGNPT